MHLYALAQATDESRLVLVLLQLAVVIGAARLFGWLFRCIRQPQVVGEIAAGIILGPSVVGKIEELVGHPDHPLSATLFNPAANDTMSILSQLGLILLMLLIGLEFQFAHVRRNLHSAAAISLAGMLVPFALGFGLAWHIGPHLESVDLGNGQSAAVDPLGLALFLGTALSITAVPVLGRMLAEFNITRTRLANVTLGAAAAGDAAGWIILASITAVVHTAFSPGATLRMAGLTLAFVALMALIVRPLLLLCLRPILRRGGGELTLLGTALLLIAALLAAIATSAIGIFAIFGGFVLGAVLADQEDLRRPIARQLTGIVTVFFLPIFFTRTGLNTRIDALSDPILWVCAAVIFAAAIAGKFAGCALAARATGFTWRESAIIGSLMNTRGLMELIVINVGFELHVIPRSIYCILVLMALLTTFITTPLVVWLRRGTELEAPMRASAVLRPFAVVSPE